MEPRPKLIIPLTALDKTIESAGYLILVILWCFTPYAYSNLPEIIPIHFDLSGQINKYGSKKTLIFLPITATVIFIGISLLNKYPHIFNYTNKITAENVERQYTTATRMLRFLKLSIAIVFTLVLFFAYFKGLGKTSEFGPLLLPVIIAIIIIPTVYFVIKLLRA